MKAVRKGGHILGTPNTNLKVQNVGGGQVRKPEKRPTENLTFCSRDHLANLAESISQMARSGPDRADPVPSVSMAGGPARRAPRKALAPAAGQLSDTVGDRLQLATWQEAADVSRASVAGARAPVPAQ